MYENTTSPETASFKIRNSLLEWRTDEPESLPFYRAQKLLSDFQLEAGLWQRKKPSLVDRILALVENVPNEEWEKLPPDMAEKYRDYKRSFAE